MTARIGKKSNPMRCHKYQVSAEGVKKKGEEIAAEEAKEKCGGCKV
jgi:hypothetical protein